MYSIYRVDLLFPGDPDRLWDAPPEGDVQPPGQKAQNFVNYSGSWTGCTTLVCMCVCVYACVYVSVNVCVCVCVCVRAHVMQK